ncbi:MAG: metal-dependent transcriptional regulator [Erysipelothrix sp.]|nr:metal-dependent transcriptional regulator [Erysipelothrix sp.]
MKKMTRSQEDYLKVIYVENLKRNMITNKLISEKMEVSAPSVSDMLNKLIKADLLVKSKDYGYKLSESGIEATQELLKKHRLWEVFLIEKLGYSWDEVHEESDVLEHVTSLKLMDKLNEYLDKPQYCPHGKVIYGNGIEENLEDIKSMNFMQVGDTGSIHIIEDDILLLQYLSKKEVKIHDIFLVESQDAFDGTLHLSVNGTKVDISERAASMIYVRSETSKA